MLVTQREIYTAYINGEDITRVIERRTRYLQALAIVLGLVGAYLIKSALGINIFADYHATDLLTLGVFR